MRTILSITAATLVTLAGTSTRADGLLYQLPADGHWAEYKLSMKDNDRDREISGTLRMSSVGQVTENDKPCRWIEMAMEMDDGGGRQQQIVAKALVPEKELTKGGKPVEGMIRGWIKMGDRDVMPLTKENYGPMPAFLSGPLTDEKKLDAKEMETKLGKLKCEGITGSTTFEEGRGKATAEYENRLHEKAPFGVVQSVIKVSTERDGKVRQEGTLTLDLAETGQDAKSKLPDSN